MNVYFLPGLAADHRLFDQIRLSGMHTECIDWPLIPEGSSIHDIAKQMSVHIDRERPHVLVGVSMGGMVAQDLAAITKPEKVVLISSWKGPQEMPRHLKLLRGKHPEKLLSNVLLYRMAPFVRKIRYQLGLETKASQQLTEDMMRKHSIQQLQVQINAALNWNGPEKPVPSLVHIHGDRDRLMPIERIKDARVIKGGTHVMVFSMANEVSAKLAEALCDAKPHL